LGNIRTCESKKKKGVKNAQEKYEFFKTIKSYLEKYPTGMKYDGYQLLTDVLLTYKCWLYIPNCDDLNRLIMDELHKRPYIGHLGYPKRIIATNKLFYWLGVKRDIVEYLDKCL
jgi:hypothetical protein